MNILHLSTHLNTGGITSYLLSLCAAQKAQGHRVYILASDGDKRAEFEKIGVEVYCLPIRTKNEFHPKVFWHIPDVIRFAKKHKIDVFHAHSRVTQVLASMSRVFCKVPMVCTAHGFFKSKISRKLFPCWGDRSIAISDLVSEDLYKTHRVKKDLIRVIYNGIDFTAFKSRLFSHDPDSIRREFNIGSDTFVIASVSRLVKDKGHAYLVEAFSQLAKKHKDTHLIIAGDGREYVAIEKNIKKHHLEAQVTLLRCVQDVSKLYAIMDVFVQCATYREGFGLTLLEAMAAKVPIIASDIWAINTIIRHGVNGTLVEPKKSKELCAAIERVILDPQRAQELACNAYENACQLYDVKRMSHEIESVYREVVAL